MFDWRKESGWDEFWGQGKIKSGEELYFYELLTKETLEMQEEAGNTPTTESGP